MTIVKDPVCGMEVEVETTPPALTFEYKGTTYYFCGRGPRADPGAGSHAIDVKPVEPRPAAG